MNKLTQLQNRIHTGNPETELVRTLYLVMCKIGSYEQLMNLPLPTLREIIKCIEWENKEQNKKGRIK